MANEEHLKILKQGVETWNCWREKAPDVRPDLSNANLSGVNLGNANFGDAYIGGANLSGANLSNANFGGAVLYSVNLDGTVLCSANLNRANLSRASLCSANLNRGDLNRANLNRANLRGADLRDTDLSRADLSRADLRDADLSCADLYETVLVDINLSEVEGLETFNHQGPSIIDHRTLARSGQLPLPFLRGIGLPDTFIDYIPSLFNQPIQFYSCFISYSSRDEAFAQRLHSDLQDKGVRCWYAPEDLPIGAKIRVGIDQAIRKHDKLLLVLSEHSVKSQWVEQEVETALEQERQRDELVLFPVRLDSAVMESGDGWTRLIKNTRNIGNFTDWKDYDSYQKGFKRLVRDLKAASESQETPQSSNQ